MEVENMENSESAENARKTSLGAALLEDLHRLMERLSEPTPEAIADAHSLLTQSRLIPKYVVDKCKNSPRGDIIVLLVDSLFRHRGDPAVVEGLWTVLSKFTSQTFAERKHFDAVYERVGEIAGTARSLDQLDASAVSLALRLLELFTDEDEKIPECPHFYFMPGTSSLSILDPISSKWHFSKGYTLVLHLFLDPHLTTSMTSSSVIYRLKSSSQCFELSLLNHELYYRIQYKNNAVYNTYSTSKPFARLEAGIWQTVVFLHDLFVVPSRFSCRIGESEYSQTLDLPLSFSCESTLDMCFCEGFVGALARLLAFASAMPETYIKAICGAMRKDSLSLSLPTHDLVFAFSPAYCAGDMVFNQHYSMFGSDLKGVLRGNCGVNQCSKMTQKWRSIDSPRSLLPFVSLAKYIPGDTGKRWLNGALEVAQRTFRWMEKHCPRSALYKSELECFTQALGYHISQCPPCILDCDSLMLLCSTGAPAKVLKLLVGTIDTWINTDFEVYTLYWKTVQSIYFSNVGASSEVLRIEHVLMMMETVERSFNRLPGGVASEAPALKSYLEPMAEFMKHNLVARGYQSRDLNSMLRSLSKKRSEEMFQLIVDILGQVGAINTDYAKSVEAMKLVQHVLVNAAGHGLGAKISCLRLALRHLAQFGDESSRREVLICSRVMLQCVSFVGGDVAAILGDSPVDRDAMAKLHQLYHDLMHWTIAGSVHPEAAVVHSEGMKLLIYVMRGIGSTEIEIKFMQDLTAISRAGANSRNLLTSKSLVKYLLRNSISRREREEADLTSVHLLGQLIAESLGSTEPIIEETLKLLRLYLTDCGDKNQERVQMTSLTLSLAWKHLVAEYRECVKRHDLNSGNWNSMPILIIHFTLFLLSDSVYHSIVPDMIQEMLELLELLWIPELRSAAVDLDTVSKLSKEYLDKLSPANRIVQLHMNYWKSPAPVNIMKTELHLFNAVSIVIAQGISASAMNTEFKKQLVTAAVTATKHFLFLMEFARTAGEAEARRRMETCCLLLLASLFQEKSEAVLALFQFMSAMMKAFPMGSVYQFYKSQFAVTKSKCAIPAETSSDNMDLESIKSVIGSDYELYLKTHTPMQKSLELISVVAAELKTDDKCSLMACCRKRAERKSREESLLQQLKEGEEERDRKYIQLVYPEIQECALKEELANAKRKSVWLKLEGQLKQWQGPWRNRALFNAPGALPQTLASHQFANHNRCLMKLRHYKAKRIDLQKYPNCFERSSLNSMNYPMLHKITCVPDSETERFVKCSKEHQSMKACDLSCIDPIRGEYSKYIGYLYLKRENSRDNRSAFPAMACEKYTGLCAKQGRVILDVKKGKAYIVFIYCSNPSTVWDKRVSYVYVPGTDKYLIKKYRVRDISLVSRKHIVEAKTALELSFHTGHSVLFNFSDKQYLDTFAKRLLRLCETLAPHMRQDCGAEKRGATEQMKITEQWCTRKISNIDYLLCLNNLAGRSFLNFSQYPVLPWTLVDFSSSERESGASAHRDLTRCIGMQGEQGRVKEFLAKFETEDPMFQEHFHYGSHYSNPGIVFQFLMRVFPIFEAYVKFFTGLDNPNRMFHSMAEMWRSACSKLDNVRELTPEFYSLPEMYLNRERRKFGEREDDKEEVGDVVLPKWSQQNPYLFVAAMREALESERVGPTLSRWIDLVFGYQQRGKEAEKCGNVFPSLSNSPAEFLKGMEDEEMKEAFRLQAYDWGQTPQQLFVRRHAERKPRSEGSMLCDFSSRIGVYTDKAHENMPFDSHSEEKPQVNFRRVIHLKVQSNASLKSKFWLVRLDGRVIEGLISEIEIDGKAAEGTKVKSGIVDSTVKKYNTGYISEEGWMLLDPSIEFNFPVQMLVTQESSLYIIQGGYVDGSILLTDLNQLEKQSRINVSTSTVCCLAVDQYERILIAGNTKGECHVFEINKAALIRPSACLVHHQGRVNFVHISDQMNLFCTCSNDGTINLYNLSHKPMIIRTIAHPSGLPFNYSLLAMSPLPTMIAYSTPECTFYSFHINGTLLTQSKETSHHLISPCISRDSNFSDCLVYVRDYDRQLGFRRVPFLERRLSRGKSGITCFALLCNAKAIISGSDRGSFVLFGDPSFLESCSS